MANMPAGAMASFITVNEIDQRLDPAVLITASFTPQLFDDGFFKDAGVHLPENIRNASKKRKAEFFAGRYLAALAMQHDNIEHFDILADESRCPIWPSQYIGSISHSDGFAACAFASKNKLSAIGIDSQEILTPARAERLWTKIIDEDELAITRSADMDLNEALTLCFSAKESIYKALYPAIQHFFGFSAAKLCSINSKKQCLEFNFSPSLASAIGLKDSLQIYFFHNDNRIFSYLSLSPELLNFTPETIK
jgi:enterobactin synthetase component D